MRGPWMCLAEEWDTYEQKEITLGLLESDCYGVESRIEIVEVKQYLGDTGVSAQSDYRFPY